MPPKAKVPDFGSHDYWDQRFTANTVPFDWLTAPDALDSLIADALSTLGEEQPQILHIGCGSSLLSQHLKTHVQHARQVHNVDYSKIAIDAEQERELEALGGDVSACTRWDAVDLLDHASLVETCGCGVYSIVVDKSTSDAISCGEDQICRLPYAVTLKRRTSTSNMVDTKPREVLTHPLQLLAVHLALATKPGARWIALSYSSDRYPFLEGEAATHKEEGTADTGMPDPRLLWTMVSKHQIEAKEQEDQGAVTHRPKVYHWVYILQRTDTRLVANN